MNVGALVSSASHAVSETYPLEERREFRGLEDVKKSIWLKFRAFEFDANCMLTPQRSLIGHPGAAFLTSNSLHIYFSVFHIFQTE
jgi:hypothetical protein